MRLTKEELKQRLIDCAESVIENAESIVGTEEYLSSLTVQLSIDAYDEAPTINVDRDFIAERFVKRLRGENV